MDANAFAAQLAAFGESLPGLVREGANRFAQEVLEGAKARTPVKTGRARAAWETVDTGTKVEVRNAVPYVEELEVGPRGVRGHHMLELSLIEAQSRHPSGVVAP